MTAAARNWGLIESGATFERLVALLVYFEDPGAALLGRRGKDGGQDVRSGDGKTVWQAKHQTSPTAARAIKNAFDEAEKIKKYKHPTHENHSLWAGVTSWVLVTNASFNSKDDERWRNEVRPEFSKLGLDATYWEEATLDYKLTTRPHVDRAFFDGRPFVFLSMAQLVSRLEEEAPFSTRAVSLPLVGRDAELATVLEFLKGDKKFLLVHGAGGVGKTKFVQELGLRVAASGERDVLWANVATMSEGSPWFDAVIPERPTLLIVDDPVSGDEPILRAITEQASIGGSMENWKVVIAARSPIDPVVGMMRSPKMSRRLQELALVPLEERPAEAMVRALLDAGPLTETSEGWRDDAATKVARAFDRHPIWMVLAVHILESEADLGVFPTRAGSLVTKYLEEIVDQAKGFKPELVLALMRWTALLANVDRTDRGLIDELSQRLSSSRSTVLPCIARLVERRALRKWGADDRFVQVKPDPVREHILREWLVFPTGTGDDLEATEVANKMMEELVASVRGGGLSDLSRSMLTGLARTEWSFRLTDQKVPLLAPFFHACRAALRDLSASQRVQLTEAVVPVAPVRPDDVVLLSRAQREIGCAREERKGYIRTLVTEHDDVVLAQAWTVFHAAHGALSAEDGGRCLEELYELADREEAIRVARGDLPNDGKRAKDLLRRAVEGGPQFARAFDAELRELIVRELESLRGPPVSPSRGAALVAVCAVAARSTRIAQWFEANAFRMQHYAPGLDSAAWAARRAVIETTLAELAREGVPGSNRVLLWLVLAEAKRGLANMGPVDVTQEVGVALAKEGIEILRSALAVLRDHPASSTELRAARSLWSWYLEFDPDSDRGLIARELEALFRGNERAAQLEELLTWGDEGAAATSKMADELAATTADQIDQFIEEARAYARDDQKLSPLYNLFRELGGRAPDSPAVAEFVQRTLADEALPAIRRAFAYAAATAWLHAVRRRDAAQVATRVGELLAGSPTTTRADLLLNFYGGPGPLPGDGVLSDEEYQLIWSAQQVFADAAVPFAYLEIVGWTFLRDAGRMRTAAEAALAAVGPKEAGRALDRLIHAVDRGVSWLKRRERADEIPSELGPWLFEQILLSPDASGASGNAAWHLTQVIRFTRRPTVHQAVAGLSLRASKAREWGEDVRFSGLGGKPLVTTHVEPLTAADAQNPEAEASIHALITLASDSGDVGYHLPKILQDLDPEGIVAPAHVVSLVESAEQAEELRRLARLAQAYPIASRAWRDIAAASIRAGKPHGEEHLHSVFFALTDRGPTAYSAPFGQVAGRFHNDVRRAEEMLEQETDESLLQLWRWQLKRAIHDREREIQRTKEDRGE